MITFFLFIAVFLIPAIILVVVALAVRKNEKLASNILLGLSILYTLVVLVAGGFCFSMT